MWQALWPYLTVLLVGGLPNNVFRSAAVLLGRGIDETSPVFDWIRIVALALLAAVVGKIVYSPPAALASVPIWVSLLGIGFGLAAFFASRRRLLVGLLAGEGAFVAAASWVGSV